MNALTTLGDDVFNGDFALAGAFDLPKTVTTIGARAFQQTIISSITLTAVTTLGDNVFDGCNSLASITSKTATPPAVPSTLGVMSNGNLVIKVPSAEAVAAYQAATGWSTYSASITK